MEPLRKIGILNKDYVDSLIVALASQGYASYVNEELMEIRK